MASQMYLNEGCGWKPQAKFWTAGRTEVSIYERGQEYIVITWSQGIWTGMYFNGDILIGVKNKRSGVVLYEMADEHPDIAKPRTRHPRIMSKAA